MHPSVLMRRSSGVGLEQRELVRDGAGPQNGITGEEEGRGRRRSGRGAEAGWGEGLGGREGGLYCSMDA